MIDLLFRNVTIVDGTGSPPFVGDVAVDDGRISTVGTVTDPAAEVVDGTGLVLCPGFVDPHTHFDAQLLWDPYASPSNLHGITTVISGNCGFTLAPMKAEDTGWTLEMMAEVEVWHANADGRYENQDPDNQPEHNLRGRFTADADGRFHFRSIRPAGYSLPDDGPVGQLARRIGLSLVRPAHIHFAVTAPGHRRLVTSIFDGSDPAIDRDALFAVKPGLIGTFRPERAGVALSVVLVLDRDDISQRNLQEG